MKLDSVTLAILGNKLAAVSEEMCLTLQRTGRTLYVKETADFACALAGGYRGDEALFGQVGNLPGDQRPGDQPFLGQL